MKIKKTTEVVISLDDLTKMLREKKILFKKQIITGIELESETGKITAICTENLNYNFKTESLQDPAVENSKEISDVLEKSIKELDISVKLLNLLKSIDKVKIKDLLTTTKSEYLKIDSFGKKTLEELEEHLLKYNLVLDE